MPATEGTELYFTFATSSNDPTSDPVSLWLNGGPGASSVAYGFWTEHGPFRLSENGTVVELYEHAWNRLSSMLYIEAPTGVGFSFSANASKYAENTDASASLDNYEALLNFFDVFTDFAVQPVWLTGESYGGHYIPTLAKRVIDGSTTSADGASLFKRTEGFLIGNPGINSDWYFNIDEYAFQTFMWSHGLMPHGAYQASVTACGWESFFTNCSADYTHPSAACKLANDNALQYVPKTWDPYSILAPTCHESGANDRLVSAYTPQLDALRKRHGMDTSYDPCISKQSPIYMNNPAVVEALHASKHYNREWPSHPPNWNYGDEKADIALLFPEFFKKAPHWRILVVSGDADAAVPFVGTERWIKCLGRPETKKFKNWMMNGDVAGQSKSPLATENLLENT